MREGLDDVGRGAREATTVGGEAVTADTVGGATMGVGAEVGSQVGMCGPGDPSSFSFYQKGRNLVSLFSILDILLTSLAPYDS